MYPKLSDLDTIRSNNKAEVFNLSFFWELHRLESDLDESEDF